MIWLCSEWYELSAKNKQVRTGSKKKSSIWRRKISMFIRHPFPDVDVKNWPEANKTDAQQYYASRWTIDRHYNSTKLGLCNGSAKQDMKEHSGRYAAILYWTGRRQWPNPSWMYAYERYECKISLWLSNCTTVFEVPGTSWCVYPMYLQRGSKGCRSNRSDPFMVQIMLWW